MESKLLQEQIDYYRARASEYDQWFLRQGRYDRGEEANENWFTEIEEVRSALAQFGPQGDVLELAGGTGLWTEMLAKTASQLTVVDASPEVLEINRARMHGKTIDYQCADLFEWRPTQRYDVVFFSFWLSHVPPERFEEFWALVTDSLKPNGRVFLVDSLYEKTSTATDHELPQATASVLTRTLNDGREFQIVKVFYDAATLGSRLKSLGWKTQLKDTEHYFYFGEVKLP